MSLKLKSAFICFLPALKFWLSTISLVPMWVKFYRKSIYISFLNYMLGMCTFLTTLHWQTKDTEYKHPWSYHSLCHEEARRSCMFLELPIRFPYSFPDHLERQWWVTLAHSVLPCAETGCVFQPDFSMVHWISVNFFFFLWAWQTLRTV